MYGACRGFSIFASIGWKHIFLNDFPTHRRLSSLRECPHFGTLCSQRRATWKSWYLWKKRQHSVFLKIIKLAADRSPRLLGRFGCSGILWVSPWSTFYENNIFKKSSSKIYYLKIVDFWKILFFDSKPVKKHDFSKMFDFEIKKTMTKNIDRGDTHIMPEHHNRSSSLGERTSQS